MLRRLALVFTLSANFALMVVAAQTVGASQSPSQIVEALRLSECALPCWVGIMPGVTRMQEVQGRVLSTGATGSFRITGSVSLEGILVGDYRLTIGDQSAAFISVAFSEGRVNQLMILASGITLGDLILAYGTPSCLSSTGDLYYDTPYGRATFVIDEASSQSYTAKSQMILIESPRESDVGQNCASASTGLSHWQGIAPMWRYVQRSLSS